MTGHGPPRATPPGLIALSPGDLTPEGVPHFARLARAATRAGLEGLMLREPRLADGVYLQLARELAPGLGWLCLHDRPHLVHACGAAAVHLGFRSCEPASVRAWLADDVAIGFSAHDGDEPEAWTGCDYLLLGPVRDTPSKRGLKEPLGLDGLERCVRAADLPVWAVGGMRPEDVYGVLRGGASGVAVLSGISMASDAGAAVKAYRSALGAVLDTGPERS